MICLLFDETFEYEIIFSNEALNIEKKLRVEDYRLLRQRFNRSAADSVDLSTKPSDKAASKEEFSCIYTLAYH